MKKADGLRSPSTVSPVSRLTSTMSSGSMPLDAVNDADRQSVLPRRVDGERLPHASWDMLRIRPDVSRS